MFPSSLLQEIKDRLSIVAIVGESVPLKPAGRNHRGLCPFHGEKTPSFMVNEEKQIFHCFGCGEGGDVFKYTMKREGLSFPESVRALAERAGVRLPEEFTKTTHAEEDAAHKKKRWGLRANQVVAEYFQACLLDEKKGLEARNYLKNRGFSDTEVFKQHFLGLADDTWDDLVRYLTSKGVPLELAAELGLIRPRQNRDGYYDFFRQRIMFPITNARGEILGFSGRTFGTPKTAEGQDAPAKFVNSPDSFIYHKSHSVFGLAPALSAIRQEDAVWLVEGNLDVMALHQAGIQHVVAPLGTALTTGHLRLVTRFTRNIWLIFDGDEAGINAARRSWPLFLELGLVPRVVVLPQGEDPDTYVQKMGADAMHKLAAASSTLGEWVVDRVMLEAGHGAAGSVIAMRELKPLLKLVHDPVEQAMYLRRVAQRFSIDESVLRASLAGSEKKQMINATLQRHSSDSLEVRSIERRVLKLILQYPELWSAMHDKLALSMMEDDFSTTILQTLQDAAGKEGLSIGRLIENLVDKDLSGMIEEMSLSEPECSEEDALAVTNGYVDILTQRFQKSQMQELNQKIAEAQALNDEPRLIELLTQKQELVRRLSWRAPQQTQKTN
ncbi:MAG: DNA primase [Deltaproteobacteria bacterium CG11_big_fil_rev_8_21_14_0_20_47_16]|nr:MAG: DNA primase [Deltaproteobacteria bacterium CG11_big_fil_rev_8_21_14_0_20_47_16]